MGTSNSKKGRTKHKHKHKANLTSSSESAEDYSVLASKTPFSVSKNESLFQLFMKLSSSVVKEGLIHKSLIFLISTEKGTSEFGEFVQALSIFHPKIPEEVKIKCEGDGAGFLNESDLILSDDVVEMIVDKAFKEADAKGDGKIDEEEWKDETHDGDGNFSFD